MHRSIRSRITKLTDFYFNTTDQIDQVNDGVGTQVGRPRLWRLRFTDITHPELGGTVEAVLDGTEGQNMLDNLTIDKRGRITLQEDVGNSAHNGKVWQYDIKSDKLTMIGKHDTDRFGDINLAATPPFNQDEESSGVIDVQNILGPGWCLLVDQAHYTTGIPFDVVEGGPLLAMHNPFDISNVSGIEAASASISKADAENFRVTVAPNPVYDYAKVFVSGAKDNVMITLTDLSGKMLWKSGNLQSNIISIPTDQLARGTYIVTVQAGTEKTNVKLVIAK